MKWIKSKPELTAQKLTSVRLANLWANQHGRPCSNEAQHSAVYITHQEHSSRKTEDVVILEREERYRERGIKEAI